MRATLVNIIKTSSRWAGTKYTALLIFDDDTRKTLRTIPCIYRRYHVKSGPINARVTITHDDISILTIEDTK